MYSTEKERWERYWELPEDEMEKDLEYVLEQRLHAKPVYWEEVRKQQRKDEIKDWVYTLLEIIMTAVALAGIILGSWVY
ncbi:MAG: hypothetical protein HUJ67_05250 [Ruminiclostridium sp.]|nr:hypothetical protein [Ruminiclostridium sp.]